MKDFLKKYLSWVLVVILLLILIFFRSCNCGSGITDKGQENDKKTGNTKYDSLKVREILDISKSSPKEIVFPSKVNLNAIHRKGAGVYLVAGEKGEVWVTPNGGLNWVQGKGTGTESLYGVAVLSHDVMLAVGKSGTIIRSTDKGLNWVNIKSGTSKDLKSVSFPDFNTGYAVGQDGIVLKSVDAGITWNTLPFSPSTIQINSVCFIDINTGWFAGKGGALYKSVNAGASWTNLDSLNTIPNNDLNCISFNSLLRGTAVGEGGIILNTTNGGANWVQHLPASAYDLKGVHRVSNLLSYIVGHGVIIRENSGVYTNTETTPANKYNAVDPSPYISGISVGETGIMTGVNTILCDDCNQKGNHDVIFLPPEGETDTRWKVRLRIYNNTNFDFKSYLRVVTPGFYLDHTIMNGWTQNDNTGTQHTLSDDASQQNINRLEYNQIGLGTISTEDDIDVATLNMNDRQAGYIELNLTPIEGNTFNNGSVEFYFGKLIAESIFGPEISFCYRVTYVLGEEQEEQ